MIETSVDEWRGERFVVAGGSGFLGGACCRHLLDAGAEVTVLSRKRPGWIDMPFAGRARWVSWSAGKDEMARSLDGARAVINFIGRTVDCRKTPANCDEILRSRVESVRTLGAAMAELERPPGVWVQAGTAHIYGDPPEERVGDDGVPGWGLAPFVGKAWETAFWAALPRGMRGIILRTSFVLGKTEGALPVLVRLAKFGLGGKAGHGRQGFSWIHEDDFVSIVERALCDENMAGTINVTAPSPVSQADFMATLRRTIGIPFGLPSPSWAVRFGARWLLDTDPELVLEGRYILPTRLQAMGHVFRYPELSQALAALLGRKER
jgi:uncharacterized protein (TIGR01777 family)